MITVPTYNDPMGFMEGNAKYPCNTQYMVYNPLEHKYYLTEEALSFYGLDVETLYPSTSNNKVQEFIYKVTKKIYDYIAYKSGWKNRAVQMYRIATAPKTIYADQYAFRKDFERVLVAEAQWILNNGDSAQYSPYDMEKGQIPNGKPEEDWRNTSDIAPEAQRTLEFLGLTRWFTLWQLPVLDQNKY